MLLPDMGVLPDGFRSPICTDGGFAMKIINVAQVMEVVDLHGCGDWGDVDVSLTTHGLRVVLCREIHILPVRNWEAVVQDVPAQATLMAWVDDMGF